jgi:hypothetical protein
MFPLLRRGLPAIAFLSGFLWDAITLGRRIQPLDLWLLLGYWAVSALILLWLGRRLSKSTPPLGPVIGTDIGTEETKSEFGISGARLDLDLQLDSDEDEEYLDEIEAEETEEGPDAAPGYAPSRWKRIHTHWIDKGPALLLQFLFGGLFSALVIFYFKSASPGPPLFLVLFLATLLIGNEFIGGHYGRFTLSWTLFSLCGILLLHFCLPHALGSVHPGWFYPSTLLALGATWGIKKLSPAAPGRLWPSWLLAIALMVAHANSLLPPVPLVLKRIQIGLSLEKEDETFALDIANPPWWAPWEISSRELPPPNGGDPIYCASSVFLPDGVSIKLIHHWRRKDAQGNWKSQSRIGFQVQGGREEGYRGYSYKRNMKPGAWEVRVEVPDGRTLGQTRFKVRADTGWGEDSFRRIRLP